MVGWNTHPYVTGCAFDLKDECFISVQCFIYGFILLCINSVFLRNYMLLCVCLISFIHVYWNCFCMHGNVFSPLHVFNLMVLKNFFLKLLGLVVRMLQIGIRA
jgi:hypothetical protein